MFHPHSRPLPPKLQPTSGELNVEAASTQANAPPPMHSTAPPPTYGPPRTEKTGATNAAEDTGALSTAVNLVSTAASSLFSSPQDSNQEPNVPPSSLASQSFDSTLPRVPLSTSPTPVALFHHPTTNPPGTLQGANSSTTTNTPTTTSTTDSAIRSARHDIAPRSHPYARQRPLPRPPKRAHAVAPASPGTSPSATTTPTKPPSSMPSSTRGTSTLRTGGTSMLRTGHRYKLPPNRGKRHDKPTPSMQTSRNSEPSSQAPHSSHLVPQKQVTQTPASAQSTGVDSDLAKATPTSETESPLEDGWQQVTDQSGRTYFYHAQSGETTWDRPTKVEGTQSLSGKIDISSQEETTPPITGEQSPAEPESSSGLQISGNANVEIAEDEVRADQVSSGPLVGEEHKDSAVALTTTTTTTLQQQELPTGWVEVKDPSGRPYFYNADLGETTWDRPTLKQEQESDAPALTVDDSCEQAEKVGPDGVDSAPAESSKGVQIVEEEVEIGEKDATATPAGTDVHVDVDLPPGWSEAADPTSGQKYYYNSETGETSWQRPAPAKSPKDEDPSTDENAEVVQQALDGDDTSLEEASLSVQPRVLTEAVHGTTTTTTPHQSEEEDAAKGSQDSNPDESPVVVSRALEVSEPSDEALNDNNGTLPPGWVEATDPTHGKSYYYNNDTGETSWEPPALNKEHETELQNSGKTRETLEAAAADGPPSTALDSATETEPVPAGKDMNDQEDDPASARDGTEISVVDMKSEPEDATQLPHGWEKVIDPSGGRPYFYNSSTGETSWDPPGSPQAFDEQATAASTQSPIETTQEEETRADPQVAKDIGAKDEEPTDPSTTIEIETSKSTSDPSGEGGATDELPSGWTEGTDPTNGQTYYYNTETGSTSWDRPVQPTVEELGETISGSKTTKDTDTKETPGPEIPNDKDEALPESTADAYHSETPAITEFENEPEKVDVDALPAGWTSAVDPSHGTTYYFNIETGESSWKRPLVPVEQEGSKIPGEMYANESVGIDADENGRTEDLKDDGEGGSVKPSIELSGGELPPGWTESTDPEGHVYFYNSETNETSRERPVFSPESNLRYEERREQPQDDEVDAVEDNGTNEDATLAISSDDKEIEYNQPEPGQSEATGILLEAQEDITGTPDRADEAVDSDAQLTDTQQVTDDQSEQPANNAEGEMSDELPAGWIAAVDPAQNRTYYYNAETGESSWDRPVQLTESVQKAEETELPEETHATDEIAVEARSTARVDDGEVAEYDEDKVPEIGLSEETDDHSPETSKPDGTAVSTARALCGSEVDEVQGTEPPEVSGVLPVGWVAVADSTGGQTYYYNSDTGETTWDRPAVLPESDLRQAEGPEQSREEYSTELEASSSAKLSLAGDENDGPEVGLGEETDPHGKKDYGIAPELESAEDSDALCAASEENRVDGTPGGDDKRTDALPACWVEAIDPTANRTYYYNTENGESSWERPPLPTESNQQQDAATDGQQVDSEARPSNSDDKHESEESRDALTLEDNGSSPAQICSVDEMVKTDDSASPTPEASIFLPPGWVSAVDPSEGRPYYYNSDTGATSWDPPALSSELNTEQAKTVVPPEELGHSAEGDSPLSSINDLTLKHQEAAQDNSFPKSAKDDLTGSGAQDSETRETGGPPSVSVVAPTLPGEESFHEPVQGGAELQGHGSEQSQGRHLAGDRATENQVDGMEKVSIAQVGNEKLFNKGETATMEAVVSLEPADEEASDENLSTVGDANPTSAETLDSLPAGWISVTEPDHGQTYYYNQETGETTWDRPTVSSKSDLVLEGSIPVPAADGRSVESEPVVPARSGEVDEAAPEDEDLVPADARPLCTPGLGADVKDDSVAAELATVEPEMSRELVGDADDRNSEHPPETELSAIPGDGSSQVDKQAVNETAALCPGWTELTDTASGEVYFYNSETGDTSWDRPVATLRDSVGDSSEPESAKGSGTAVLSEQKVIEPEACDPRLEAPAEPESQLKQSDLDNSPIPVLLPNGWVEAIDDASGQKYYFNSETGETSWDLPGDGSKSEGRGKSDQPHAHVVTTDTDENQGIERAEHSVELDPTAMPKDKLSSSFGTKVEDSTEHSIQPTREVTHAAEDEARPAEQGTNPCSVIESVPEVTTEDGGKGVTDHKDAARTEVLESLNNELPPGWQEVFDQASNMTYFFNETSGETSWDRPVSDVVAAAQENVPAPLDDSVVTLGEKEVPESGPTVRLGRGCCVTGVAGQRRGWWRGSWTLCCIKNNCTQF